MKQLAIYGAGGHGRVVCESAYRSGAYDIVGFIDDDVPPGTEIAGHVVIGDFPTFCEQHGQSVSIAMGIGAMASRRQVVQNLNSQGYQMATIVDPTAIVSASAQIDAGAFVAAGAIINSQASLGAATIVNTGAIVEHDCQIGDFAEIAPGTVLGGCVTVGSGAVIGMGAVVRQGQSIGSDSIVGAGAVVVADVPPNIVAFGVPARRIRGVTDGD